MSVWNNVYQYLSVEETRRVIQQEGMLVSVFYLQWTECVKDEFRELGHRLTKTWRRQLKKGDPQWQSVPEHTITTTVILVQNYTIEARQYCTK